jgi:transcriptional regulator CtsR
MTAIQIIGEINKLSFSERISVIENALKSIRQEVKRKANMKNAAKLLLDDYLNDKELTAFTSLDFESFYETK